MGLAFFAKIRFNLSMLGVLGIRWLPLWLCGVLALAVCPLWSQVGSDPFELPDWVTAESDIAYGTEAEQKLDVYTPKSAANGKRPGVLLIHGGGYRQGSRKAVLRIHAIPYLRKGFVVASIDYRLTQTAKAPAAVNDTLAALDWFHSNAKRLNVDNSRIITVGASAGGHLALMAGMVTKQAKLGPVRSVAAIINVFGVADMGELLTGPNKQDVILDWIPDGPAQREMARAMSPIIYVRKGLPPVKSVHGTEDPTVPYEQSVRLTRLLREKGVTAELISVPGGKHGFDDKTWNEDVYPQIFEFLERQRVLR
ncbi:MAG: alpha/beta hydrolase [Bryobacterales bacterium]|nr:alpha/beta hydrolase [Bryobacterales bacterium]